MAMVVDQQPPTYKHFCKICKKGFGCGRALGGHMRAHGIGDENMHMDDDEPSDWDGNATSGNKRMYALRTNPNRLKSCRVCENCGKEFSSWKSFLEHGKCISEDVDESLVSSPGGSKEEDGVAGWYKRRRSKRAKLNLNCPSSEEEDLAHCLVMLSASRVDHPIVTTDVEAEAEESCASASRDEERHNVIAPLTNNHHLSVNDKAKSVVGKGMFECKACKKVFNSHQALGGHRASHKKVKGCFAAKLDDNLDESNIEEDVITRNEYLNVPSRSNAVMAYERASGADLQLGTPSKRKSKLHECSICHRIFSSGQALGGHKRCHWVTSNSPDATSVSKFRQHFKEQQIQEFHHQTPQFNKPPEMTLDLNIPVSSIRVEKLDQLENPLSLEISTDICLRPWIGANIAHDNETDHNHQHCHHQKKDYNNHNTTTTNVDASIVKVDDEVDIKVKLAKLNDLKDLNLSCSSSPWLQMGIGSTSNNEGSDP